MKIKVIYIISNINKALAFEWIAESLDTQKFDLSFILLNPGDSVLEKYLKQHKILVQRVTYRGKKDFIPAFWKVFKILKTTKPKVIHCHLFDASLIGLLAGKILGVPKRIFTRHHASMHHVYFPRAVYYDRFINFLATDIIAITQNVKEILLQQEAVKPKKIQVIHHGFKLEEFLKSNIDKSRIQNLAKKYQAKNKFPVIGVIARQTHLKGIQFVIPAFEKLLKDYPQAHLILANAVGDYQEEVNKLLSNLPDNSYTSIPFEQDLFALFQLFDVYIHIPIDSHLEAFGQTYVEALAAGIPAVFTLSGVANEFIVHEKNALLVPYQDIEATYQAILRYINMPKDLKEKIIKQGQEDVQKRFSLQKMIDQLSSLYVQ